MASLFQPGQASDLLIEPPMAHRRRGRGFVLVTGGAGYIGSLLVRRLLDRGYRVRVLDRLLYGDVGIRHLRGHPDLELRVADFRHVDAVARAVAGVRAVVHLGAIVGDPACAIDPDLAISTNLAATRTIAEACRRARVPRLLFASTCSVYGASDEVLDESSALNPVSLYARAKAGAEEALLALHDDAFAPVILRFATAHGYSCRPRFDLAVNVMTANAVVEGRITVHGGEQWRPFVHADDIGRALILALEAPIDTVAGQVLNVGSNDQNHRLAEVGEIIGSLLPSAKVVMDDRIVDRRNYYVRFDKIRRLLGFAPAHDLPSSVLALKVALESGAVGEYRDPRYDNYRFLLTNLPDAVAPPSPRPATAGADTAVGLPATGND